MGTTATVGSAFATAQPRTFAVATAIPAADAKPAPALTVPDDAAAALSAAVAAGTAAATSWAAAHPGGSARDFDASVLAALSGPPTGDAAAADLARVKQAQGTRDAAGTAFAKQAAHDDGNSFWDAAIAEIGRTSGADQARRAADLVQQAQQRGDDISSAGKRRFDRKRPFEVDPTITTLVHKPEGNASYPSGHATGAYAAALVLASFLPARRDELVGDAAKVAWSRVYAGVHFLTDVAAGAQLASSVAADLLRRSSAA